ncbi:MAG: cobalamin-dependent protein [Acidobacteria bacterium]|jgi:5-methyltetrahydrofolate--homocysteine methyltransferase|nr:cobalamin-dependent protein [Acidobacteriota bacterium]
MLDTLVQAISDMKEEQALAEARALLAAGEDPMRIVESCSSAMELVGRRFEAGEYFLAELMMAGDLVRQVSDLVKPELRGRAEAAKRGSIVIGTVKGDIHNIGKDIVAFLLDVNGFDVHDLGVDVAPATFVEAIREHEAGVLGLSGLLTVAFDSMKSTIRAIEDAGLRDRVRIMIGGGQTSDAVRQYAGADAYCRDAFAGVSLAREWVD